MKQGMEESVLRLIDERRDEIVGFLKDLVAIPSVTGEEWRSRNSSRRNSRPWASGWTRGFRTRRP